MWTITAFGWTLIIAACALLGLIATAYISLLRLRTGGYVRGGYTLRKDEVPAQLRPSERWRDS